MEKKVVPIGRDNFKDIIENNFYYVDKTDIIESLLKNKNYVSLFTRPRRFGKSLFISMLDNFFNIEYKDANKNLFKGLNISKSKYYSELSSRPVIKLDFKDISGESYEEVLEAYKFVITDLYKSKRYLIDELAADDKELYNRFLNKTADLTEYKMAIKIMSKFLYKYYNRKVIILIDEYDIPIQKAYLKGFYDSVITLIKTVFSSSLKTNDNIEMGIMTGVLRVSKESLFSDLNNVEIYGIADNNTNIGSESFGFTEDETKQILTPLKLYPSYICLTSLVNSQL